MHPGLQIHNKTPCVNHASRFANTQQNTLESSMHPGLQIHNKTPLSVACIQACKKHNKTLLSKASLNFIKSSFTASGQNIKKHLGVTQYLLKYSRLGLFRFSKGLPVTNCCIKLNKNQKTYLKLAEYQKAVTNNS